MARQSHFLKHSEEPVSYDPLQDILRPPSDHSDTAASGPFPQITTGVWPRSLVASALTAEHLLQSVEMGASGGHG